MCKNATATAAALLEGIEPTFTSLLHLEGLDTTPDGEAAINAYNAAVQAVKNWTPGSTATVAVEAINAFNAVFDVLPFTTEVKSLVSIISAGITTVIGVITANSPAPATPSSATANEEESTVAYQHAVVERTTQEVQTLVPGFKRSIFTSPAHQYRNAWNSQVGKLVAAIGSKYTVLKVA